MKITRHKHGLELGWNNLFFLYDGKSAEQGTYNSYVEAKGFHFARFSIVNVGVMTPAQQLLWQENRETLKHSLNPEMRQWLERNIGKRGPDWYAREEEFDLIFLSILFRRRGDALKLIRYVEESLTLAKD